MKTKMEKLIERVLKHNPNADVENISKAFEKANEAHEGQMRKSGEPYIIHPVAVAEIIASMGLDSESIIAGILHDCIEDTDYDYDAIKAEFGKSVADLVDGVTRLGMIRYSKEQEQMEDLRKMFIAMAKDIRVILIKLADRLHNMRTMKHLPEHKQRDKSLETMEVYAPIAHRLGMQRIKWELEDLSLKHLDPVGYDEIITGLNAQSEEREDFIESNKERIGSKLLENGIEAVISGRVKHIYSIYRKMYAQHKTIDEIYDISAMRVMVQSVADCYNVLGYIHDLYKPIPGRFKDYISTPKPNGYRSLHTTVIGRAGIPFEVQIRTAEMHKLAEYGVAAHWKYKAGAVNTSAGDESAFAWIRQLLEAQQDSDAEDFIKTIKVDLFADEVFVFTPKGDVINMPAGAIPIDFAYAIHTAVGNRMTGCKINGKHAAIDTVLKNGDIVEIATSKETYGPNRGWLKIVRTSEARNKIKQWFKKQCREENIIQGREELERELRSNLLYQSFQENEDIAANLLKKFSFKSLDELYSNIGYGGITVSKVVNKIKDDVVRIKKQKEKEAVLEKGIDNTATKKSSKSNSGVVVEGIDNCLIKFARCCTPIPGDNIIGFITRGYGVSVHRQDCVNVKSYETGEDRARWVNVWWDEEYIAARTKFNTAIQISAKARLGLLSDVVTILSSSHVNIQEFNSRDLSDGYAVINMIVDVSGISQLENLQNKLTAIKGVINVIRQIT